MRKVQDYCGARRHSIGDITASPSHPDAETLLWAGDAPLIQDGRLVKVTRVNCADLSRYPCWNAVARPLWAADTASYHRSTAADRRGLGR